jgi:hypothetical protein
MSSDLFIVLRLWTKYRIDLIEQERWSAIVISDLAEKIMQEKRSPPRPASARAVR